MVAVTGDKEVVQKMLLMKSRVFRAVVRAVEQSAVRMANHAKAGHEHGSNPHARNRYENQTGNLTSSIFPGGPEGMKFEELSEDRIVGLFGVGANSAGSPMEYAAQVEERYPFIWPAAMANMRNFKNAVRDAVIDATK